MAISRLRKSRKRKDAPLCQTGFQQGETFTRIAAFAGMALAAAPDSIPAEFGFAREALAELQTEFPHARVAYATVTDTAGSTQSFEPAMITEADAEKAVDYLRDSARRTAKARAEHAYLDAFTKVVKGKIMREHAGKEPVNAQEAIAYASPVYQLHLDAVRTAAEAMEYERFMREAASAKFEAWRTQQANERAGRP